MNQRTNMVTLAMATAIAALAAGCAANGEPEPRESSESNLSFGDWLAGDDQPRPESHSDITRRMTQMGFVDPHWSYENDDGACRRRIAFDTRGGGLQFLHREECGGDTTVTWGTFWFRGATLNTYDNRSFSSAPPPDTIWAFDEQDKTLTHPSGRVYTPSSLPYEPIDRPAR